MKPFTFLAVLLSLCGYSCGQTAINNVSLSVSSLAVLPANPSTVAGGKVTFDCVATLTGQATPGGNFSTKTITNQAVWLSSAPAVASMGTNVTGLNVATGQSVGTSTISCQDPTGTVSPGVTTLTVLSSPSITNPNAAACANPCPLPAGQQTVLYSSFTFAAVGGVLPYTWSNSVGLPPTGMSLSSAGVLSGTPLGAPGTTNWTVQVCDNIASCASVPVSLVVAGAPSCGVPPNYCAYVGVDIKQWPSVPNVGVLTKNGSTVTDSSLPSSLQSPIMRCTDFAFGPGAASITQNAQSKSAGLGGGAKKQLFNVDSTMVHINSSGGSGFIALFNPSTMVCGDPITGFAITADKNGGSSSVVYNFGNGSFSWSDSEVTTGKSAYYAVGSGNDITNATGVAKYTIDKTNGTFTVNNNVLDFANGLPWSTALAPAWQANHPYSTGDYVSFQFTGLPDWNGATSWALGDLIKPSVGNPLNCVFKLSVLGTRGSQPSVWSTLSNGTCNKEVLNGGLRTEGSGGVEGWRVAGTGAFVFQLISASGTSGGATPAFAAVPGGAQTVHPDLMSTVTDGALTWENVGALVNPVWHSFAGVSKNSNRFASAFSTNVYGHGTGSYNNDNGGQGTGNWAVAYDSSISKFVLLNTITGIQSVSISGGALTAQGAALTGITGGCTFNLHNLESGSTIDNVVVAVQGKYTGTCPLAASGTNVLFRWKPFATYDSTTTLQAYNTLSNHWGIGNNLLVNLQASNINFGFTSGAYDIIVDSRTPTATAVTSWQVGAPFTNACDVSWVANDLNPACNFTAPYDSHLAYWNDPLDDDLGPMCGTIYNVGTLAPPPVAPYQGEVVCVTTTPTWNPSVGPIGAYKVFRFTHTFNTGGNAFFDDQFTIPQLSQDGKFLAFGSDWNCSLGTTAGASTGILCGAPWVAGTNYATNTMINPYSATGGTGTNFGVYQVQAPGGVAAATKPAWFVCNSGSANTTVTDANGIVYKCLGSGNAKGEVFIVGLK